MSLPPNAHVSTHPCVLAKLSQLRSRAATSRDVQRLVHEIALLVSAEALGTSGGVLTTSNGPFARTPLGFDYVTTTTTTTTTTTATTTVLTLVPILRSGLSMVDALQTVLPDPVPVHHLGLYREPSTLQPVEYYNNFPSPAPDVAILLDPVIATGGTCAAAIQSLREWGVRRVLVISVVAALAGLQRAAGEWADGTEVWLAGVDPLLTPAGMLEPGLGDIGDRLFLTMGK